MSLPATIPEYTGNPVLDQFHHAKKARDQRKRRAARAVKAECMPAPEPENRDSVIKARPAPAMTKETMLRAYANKKRAEIDAQIRSLLQTRELLFGARPITTTEIVAEVCDKYAELFEVSPHDVYSSRRAREICFVRHEIWYRCKTETPHSLPAIGKFFGRDHTTVLHGVGTYQSYQQAKKGQAQLSPTKRGFIPLHMIIDPEVA